MHAAAAAIAILSGFGISSSMSVTSGYFHNTRITAVDNARKTVPFRYKSWLDVRTREKTFKTVSMNMYEFMAKMLFFLPKKHKKMIRCYGIYAHGAGEKLKKIATPHGRRPLHDGLFPGGLGHFLNKE